MTTYRLQFVLLFLVGMAVALLGLAAMRMIGAARADEAHMTATSAPAPAPVVTIAPPDPPSANDVRLLWRRGEYVGAGVLALFGLLVIAARVDPRRALYYTAGLTALGGCVDLVANGQTPSAGMLVGALAVFAALVTRSPIPTRRQPEAGFAAAPVLAILSCAAFTIGAMGAWSCAGSRRVAGAVHDTVVDCAKHTIEARAEEYADRIGAAILDGTRPNGEVSFVRARAEIAVILESAGLEIAGCAAATAVARILYPRADRPRGLISPPEPSAAMVRDGWDDARADLLKGRRFQVTIGTL